MPSVGITGNIGSGKSTFSAALAQNPDFFFIDADKEAHQLYQTYPEILGELAKVFGTQILDPKGNLLRPALGKIVFSNPEALQQLNSIVHPHLKSHLKNLREKSLKKHSHVFLDGALIVEWESYKELDHLVLIETPDDLRLQRIIARGLEIKQAKERMASQMPSHLKRPFAQTLIKNSGSTTDLERIAREFEKDLLNRSPKKQYPSEKN